MNGKTAVTRRQAAAILGALGASAACAKGGGTHPGGTALLASVENKVVPDASAAAPADSAHPIATVPANGAAVFGSFDITHFGAKGDGQADDTTAIQCAIYEAQKVGGILYIPPGSYKITATLHVSKSITIWCCGYEGEQGKIYQSQAVTAAQGFTGSVIVAAMSAPALTIQSNCAATLSGFQITYPTRPADDVVAVVVQAESGAGNGNTGTVIRDILITGHAIGLELINCLDFVIDNLNLSLGWIGGMVLSTPNYPKWGDSTISGCTFTGNGVPSYLYHICISSGGGLRVINNKFNYGGVNTSAILVAPNLAEVNVEPLMIANNSIEGCAFGVNFANAHVAGEVSAVTITGNEIWAGLSAIYANTFATTWITGISIVGNILMVNSTSTQPIVLLDAVQFGVITGNTFTVSGSATGSGAIALGAGSSYINVQSNAYSSTALTVVSSGAHNKLGGGST